MDLIWEDPPVPANTFFNRDLYDKCSLAPNLKELWDIAQSQVEKGNVKPECDDGDADGGETNEDSAEITYDGKTNAEDESSWNNCDSDDHCSKITEDSTDNMNVKKKEHEAYPEPRLPYPCMSSMSIKDQKTYLSILRSKKPREPPEKLKVQVNIEVGHFMKYLHDVSKLCSDDYNYISQGAMKYSEDYLTACVEKVTSLPQLYRLCEMTSLTGGTFHPGLTLAFEKQLLVMGSVDITDHTMVPADAQLASDYQSVSSQNPPAKKARDKCAPISSDKNAERLSSHYEPHVCLTRDALVTLLDNHGPEFCEPWELPVWVKLDPGKEQRKVVYIDSPLLKSEVTIRERSQLFHEESLKLSVNKRGKIDVCQVMTETPAVDQTLPPGHSKRDLVALEDTGLDFEAFDLSDLETFGDTNVRPSKKQKTTQSVKCDKPVTTQEEEEEEEEEATATEVEDFIKDDTPVLGVGEGCVPPVSPPLQPMQGPAHDADPAGDSEDERLVIDDPVVPATAAPEPRTAVTAADGPATSTPNPHRGVARRKRASKMAGAPGDPLGQILRMQTAMLKPSVDSKCPPPATPDASSPKPPSGHAHSTSLVKLCVSSYLESGQNQDGEAFTAAAQEHAYAATSEQRKLLPEHLQLFQEDQRDYEAPDEGSLLYKLYSLLDLLLVVRSALPLTHTRNVGNRTNQYVPVHLLPKLEYQLCYGVECLSRSELCQLWAESLLHSSTVSYIAHISAHTSKVALLRKLPVNWKQKMYCDFKPSKSLNILHHMLKKLTGLEEGRYVVGHRAGEPFATLYKAGATGKVTRGTYDLHQVHSAAPRPAAGRPAPWLPVDPTVVLSFHQSHGRVPCTFPPRDLLQAVGEGYGGPTPPTSGRWRPAGQRQANTGAKKKKKKANKGKRAARRKKPRSKGLVSPT